MPPQLKVLYKVVKSGRWVGANIVDPMSAVYKNSVVTPFVTNTINNPPSTSKNIAHTMSMSPQAKAFWKNAGMTIATLVGNAVKNQASTPRVYPLMPPAQGSYNLSDIPPATTDGTPDPNSPTAKSSGFEFSNPVVQVGLVALGIWLLTGKK
jgi:hypothetical protein